MIQETSSKDNKAIGRKEIVFSIKHDGKSQPSRAELNSLLKSKVKEKFFVIRKIKQSFGKAESEVLVHAYKDEKTMNFYEPQHLFKRVKEKKEEKKEEVVKEVKKDGIRSESKEQGKKEENKAPAKQEG